MVVLGVLLMATPVLFMAAASAGPISDLWWATADACAPARDALRENGTTRDEPSTDYSPYEYDPFKHHSCGDLRDDAERRAYDEVGKPDPYHECNSSFTPFRICVVIFSNTPCDVYIEALTWRCLGGLDPDNHPV